MRHLLLALALLLAACGAPDGRRGVVVPHGPVNRAELERAVDGLREATDGDTDLAIGTACDGRYCIVLAAVADYRCPPGTGDATGKPCSGHTNERGVEGVIVHVDAELGNDAASMAHELLHAVGVWEHAEHAARDELMFPERDIGATRVFGAGTAAVYCDAFGVDPPGGVTF